MIQDLPHPLDVVRIEIKTTLELSETNEFLEFSIQDEPGRTDFEFLQSVGRANLGKIRLQTLPGNKCRFESYNPPMPSRYDVSWRLFVEYYASPGPHPYCVYQYLRDREDWLKKNEAAESFSMEYDNYIIEDTRVGFIEEKFTVEKIKEAISTIDENRPKEHQRRIELHQQIIKMITTNLRKKKLWPEPIVVLPPSKPGRLPKAENDWAYEQICIKHRERHIVYSEWLEKIGDQSNLLVDPKDSFTQALKYRKKKKMKQ